jgi:hypothetical protein
MAGTNDNRGRDGKRSGAATPAGRAGSQSPQTGKAQSKANSKKK